jgi:hypothetical protein
MTTEATLAHHLQALSESMAYLIWKAEPFVALATDPFVIHGGKIVTQTDVILAPPSA